MHKYTAATFFIIVILSGCRCDRSKKELQRTTVVCDKMYVQTFVIFGGGAGGGDRVSEYLTDSTTFTKYIGTYVQGYNYYNYQCFGDTIQIEKIDNYARTKKTVETKKYLLTDLKKEGKRE